MQILYEDNHLIAVYKKAGLLVQGDETGEKCLMDEVKNYLKDKYHKPGRVFLGLLHRIDRPVSGIVLFAKTSKGASRLSKQFREYQIQKIYHALVINKPVHPQNTLQNWLLKNSQKNQVKIFNKKKTGAVEAILSYEVLRSNNHNSLLKIVPLTGRHHQIRAQLAAINCPIVGDIKYGAPSPLPDKSIALLASGLTFFTATQIKKISLSLSPNLLPSPPSCPKI